MESNSSSPNFNGEECEDPHCQGCQKPIEDGSVVQFGEGIWHFECFRCAKCHKLVECYSNLLLLRDGSPICEDCSYSCHACKKTIKDEAIMTGDEAYHADCFCCIQCNKRIDDLVFTQTSKGIYCTKCHETRKILRSKRRDERIREGNHSNRVPNQVNHTRPSKLPSTDISRYSSTTSIVNAYSNNNCGTPIRVESNDILALNDILSSQRNSEETLRNSLEMEHNKMYTDQTGDSVQIRELKKELRETKTKLREVDTKFIRIKTISRKALEEFHTVKNGYAAEIVARREAESMIARLQSELLFHQQALIFSSHDFINYTKSEIDDLNQHRADLEQICHDLRLERDALINELELHSKNIEQLLISQRPQDLHWERLQHSYQHQLDSMQKDMDIARNNYAKLVKGRDDIIADMILLNTKNAELSQLNNDLSRRVNEKEQEAKAIFAGMSFLNAPDDSRSTMVHSNLSASNSSSSSSSNKHRRNLSTGSINIHHSNSIPDIQTSNEPFSHVTITPKMAQRDSFNGSAAPKLFKFRRNRSGSSKNKLNKSSEDKIISIPYDTNKPLELVSETITKNKESDNTNTVRGGSKHHFIPTKFIRPTKCDACGEKMWRVNELRCADCYVVCHFKCLYSAPQTCNRKSNSDSNKYEDHAQHMFGNDLIKQIQAEKTKVPIIVEKCIEAVERRGMDYEGIYRKSGGVGQMRQIQQTFERGEIPNLIDEEKWNDICAITSVLKQYFRELPNPLFTYELHSKFMDSMLISNAKDQLNTVAQLIQTLPIENYNTLKYLMDHLDRIQKRNKENLMTSKNLAVIFGPTLLRHQEENRDLLEMNHKIGMIEFILNHMKSLFIIETTLGKSSNTLTTLIGNDHRRAFLSPQLSVQHGKDLNSILDNYQLNHDKSSSSPIIALPAVPPRENAGYI
ncbi:hypothetical protein BDB01DRAFT_443558 [Pilobolus umbonatus]|nr:hypothetical protein BDB01DRAFT_443558 [Pilobolus umbonatus]